MTEKSLKIRIKMHSPTDSPQLMTQGTDNLEGNTDSTSLTAGGNKLRMGLIAMISGIVILTIAFIFLNLRDRDAPQVATGLGETTSDLATEGQPDGNVSDEKVALLSVLAQESAKTHGLDDDSVDASTNVVQNSKGYDIVTQGKSSVSLTKSASSHDINDPTHASSLPAEPVNDQNQTGQHSEVQSDRLGTVQGEKLVGNLPIPAEGGALEPVTVSRHPQTSNNRSNQSSPEADVFVEPSSAEANTTQSRFLSPRIARAQFTNGIQRREPIDRVESVVHSDGQTDQLLFYFTELRDLKGETVTHRWEHEGEMVAEVSFNVGGNRWRVFSSKSLPPNMTGEWQVIVTNSEGAHLTVASFVYQGY